MTTQSWLTISPSMVDQAFAREFLGKHADFADARFNPYRGTSREHATALHGVATSYRAAMNDGGLSLDDRELLAELMTSTNYAALDAEYDNMAARYLGTGFDPGYFDPRAEMRDHRTPGPRSRDFGAGYRDIQRAEDGGIIYDRAPSFSDVRAGDARIGLGHKGSNIEDIQNKLYEGGYYDSLYPRGTDKSEIVDGFHGEKTARALALWQSDHGLRQTGELNGRQLDALLDDDAHHDLHHRDYDYGAGHGPGRHRYDYDRHYGRRDYDAGHGPGRHRFDYDSHYGDRGPRDGPGRHRYDPYPAHYADRSSSRTHSADREEASDEAQWFTGHHDLFGGVEEDQKVTAFRDREMADGATQAGAGYEARAYILDTPKTEWGNADEHGAEIDGDVVLDVYGGAEGFYKNDEEGQAIAGKVGAYAAVDAEGTAGVGLFGWFGVGGKGSVGVGGGAQAEAAVTNVDERLSFSAGAKAGKGYTVGLGADIWIDYGQIKEDVSGWGTALYNMLPEAPDWPDLGRDQG